MLQNIILWCLLFNILAYFFNVVEMAAKNVVADLNKLEKLDGDNYDI